MLNHGPSRLCAACRMNLDVLETLTVWGSLPGAAFNFGSNGGISMGMLKRFGVTALHSSGSGDPVACHSPLREVTTFVGGILSRVTWIHTVLAGLGVSTSAVKYGEVTG